MKRLFSRTAIAASLGLMLLNTGCTPENLTALNGILKQTQLQSAEQQSAPLKGIRPYRPVVNQGEREADRPVSSEANRQPGASTVMSEKPAYTHPEVEPTPVPSPEAEKPAYTHPEAEPTPVPSPEAEKPTYTHPEAEPTPVPSSEAERPAYTHPEAEPTPVPETEHTVDVSHEVFCQSAILKVNFGQIEGEPLKAWSGSASVKYGKIILLRDQHFIPAHMANVNDEGSLLEWQTNTTDVYDGLTFMVQGDGSGQMPVLTLRTELGEKEIALEALPFLHENQEVGETGYRLGFEGSAGDDCH
jgi:hypothetical protein